ncbi:hypothetical protein [Streptomyces sp. RKAG293]|uniref:tetratricopeptide repeat protein n=1 Tax=Streptomyces sp. RKAG293 TaxID=2893403 RepID=UPI0020340656|nr:hypothetical protein [Streptomyces sp. RKAG293]MCM2418996.1 hypothetical protein [Streptomyces sp. RKAG293]
MESEDGIGSAERDFIQALRALGAMHRDVLGRQPSARTLARSVGVSPTTVGKWLEGAQVPQQPEQIVAVVRILRTEAEQRRRLSTETSPLLDGEIWGNRHRAVLQERAIFTGRRVERANAEAEIFRQVQQSRTDALADIPRPVHDWTPAQLGVHPAIAGLGDEAGGFVLPKYIPRTHDEKLRHLLRSIATSQRVEIIVLRGESCTGKTRSAYEAVLSCLPDWQLLFPKDSASLTAALDAGAIGAKTVLWLNEAQHYLSGEGSESSAAALRRRLEGAGPTVAILTLWPEHYRSLASDASSHPGGSAHVTALLDQTSLHVVPNQLSAAELSVLNDETDSDASLAAAHRASGETGRVTQILAAGPDLVDHYEHPVGPYGCYGKALITAAMDARRLGATAPLPLDFLIAAAPGYLTDSQRAEAPDDWQENAIIYTQRRIKSVASAFSPVPKSSGIGPEPGVIDLADYLHHYSRKTRRAKCPPNSFWEAATSLISSAHDINRLAISAIHRLRVRHGAALADTAAALGESEALWELAHQSYELGNAEKSQELLLRIAVSGEPAAWVALATEKQDAGDIEGSREMYRKAADLGQLVELRQWADSEAINDRQEIAIWLYRLLIERGDTLSFYGLASLLQEMGQTEEAELIYEKGMQLGDVQSAYALAQINEANGKTSKADEIRLGITPALDHGTLLDLMLLHERHGRKEDAETVYWQLVEAGEERTATFLPWGRASSGDLEEAERIANEAAERGFFESLEIVTIQCIRNGDDHEAGRLIQRLKEMGGLRPSVDIAFYFERIGEHAEAESMASNPGDSRLSGYSLLKLAEYRAERGDIEIARNTAMRLFQDGETLALSYLMDFDLKDGDHSKAEHWARLSVDAGDIRPLMTLAGKNTANESLQLILKNGLEPDGTTSPRPTSSTPSSP